MKIKINKTIYNIKFVNKLKLDGVVCDGIIYWDGRNRRGYLNKKRNLIEIADRADKKHTLFHEITHALFAELAEKKPHLKRLADKCNHDENFVDGLALLMMDCFRLRNSDSSLNNETKTI